MIRSQTSLRSPLPAAIAACLVALLVAGCGRGEGSETPPAPDSMTEAEYIDEIAALTVAVDEGLSGVEARERAAELGGGKYTREEIEGFGETLKKRPERWIEVEKEIDARVAVLEGSTTGG